MEEMVSLNVILTIAKKRFLLLITTIVLGLGVASITTYFFIIPKFSASAELIVQSKNENSAMNLQSDIQANVFLINTYKDMILGDIVLNRVSEEIESSTDYQVTKSELAQMIDVLQSPGSQMFQIKITTDDSKKSAIISNLTAKVFREKAMEILDVSRVTITSAAQSNSLPISPNKKLNMAIGVLLGLALGIGIVFLLENLDKTVKDKRFISEELALPILGTVNEMSTKELEKGRAVQLTAVVTSTTETKRDSRMQRNRI